MEESAPPNNKQVLGPGVLGETATWAKRGHQLGLGDSSGVSSGFPRTYLSQLHPGPCRGTEFWNRNTAVLLDLGDTPLDPQSPICKTEVKVAPLTPPEVGGDRHIQHSSHEKEMHILLNSCFLQCGLGLGRMGAKAPFHRHTQWLRWSCAPRSA